jgi:hypothetical protein
VAEGGEATQELVPDLTGGGCEEEVHGNTSVS